MRKLMMAVAAGALATAGCGGPPSPPVDISGHTNNHGTRTATASMQLSLADFYFAPTFIKATPGQQVTIELKNTGDYPHTFTAPQLGIDQQVGPGGRKMITLTMPQPGTVVFVCRFHVSMGMQGALVVG